MTGNLTAISWNIQGEVGITDQRMRQQLDLLDEHTDEVDYFLFQAVNFEVGSDREWDGQLGTLINYFRDRDFYVTHTGDWARELYNSTVQPHADIQSAHNRCNLTASRWPIERHALTLRNRGDGKPRNLNYYYSHFPEKILVSRVDVSNADVCEADSLALWNVGIINGANWGEEKVNMLETIYARIYLEASKTEIPLVLGGDFNAPKRETADGEITPHGENKGQYRNYPYYGDPHYLRDDGERVDELRFDQRYQLSEARIFDKTVGSWNLTDVYWAAEKSPNKSSTDDFTHIVPTGIPPRKRLDHIFVTDGSEVHTCEIWNGVGGSIDGLIASDHAPVFADLSV